MDAQTVSKPPRRPGVIPMLVTGCVILASLLTGSILFGSLREGIRQDVLDNISGVGRLKANQLNYWLDDRLTDARIFTEGSFFSHEVMRWMRGGRRDEGQRERIIERMGGFMGGKGFHSIALYDVSGRLLLRAGDADSEEVSLAARVREVALDGQALFLDLHPHPDAAFPVGMGFLSPLREGGEIIGVIYLAEDPERFLYPLINEWPSGSQTAETLLVRKEGDSVLYLDRLRHRDDLPLTYRSPLSSPRLASRVAQDNRQGLIEGILDYRDEPVLAYATAINGTPWLLISKVDEAEAFRMVDHMRKATLVLALFIYGLIGAWFWQWRKRSQSALEAVLLKERLGADRMLMEGEKRFRMVFENTSLPMSRNALNGEFVEVNKAWSAAFGYGKDEALSLHLSWQRATHPEDIEPNTALTKRLLTGEIEEFKTEKRYLRKDGSVLWGVVQVSLVRDANGMPEYFVSAIQDVTQRKHLERELEDNLSILQMALEGAQEAVWEWDLVTGQAKFSPQYYTMLGYQPDEFPATQTEWLAHIHPEERDSVLARIQDELAHKQDLYIAEYRMLGKDGRYRWIQGRGKCIAFDATGGPTRMVGINIDITERKQSELQISFMAYHDKLTGLPNRALLFDRLSQAMSQARRDSRHVALLFVDLDGFKAVNDQFGHEAGDTVLKMAAQRFLACVRAVDTVSRFGGDEFAIVLGNLEEPLLAKSVAEKIVHAFGQSIMLADGNECVVGTSVGIGIFPEHGSALDSLLTAADHAMYESKRRGKNTYTFFRDESPDKEQKQWLSLQPNHLGGVREIDEQHRNLAYLVNRLNEALRRNDSPESILQMFDELLVATTHHFETESRYMTVCSYPDQGAHETEHAMLVNDALRFKSQLGQGRELLALQSIKDWLLNHIATSDKRLSEYLVQQGIA